MTNRQYTLLDKMLIQVEEFLSGGLNQPIASRPNPAKDLHESQLTEAERQLSGALMRVNHTGEVCAQALYQGQLAVAQSQPTREMLKKASAEEIDHLAWTSERIRELKSHRSYLNPLWYGGAFFMGVIAGMAGDRWSLGFVEETEQQVSLHLENHLQRLPIADEKSRKIISQMHADEMHHGQSAKAAGAHSLPPMVKFLMSIHAKVMTTTAYWI